MLLIDELREAWRSEPREHRVALVGVLVTALALRLPYIDQPMRYDESVSFMYFIRRSWADALSLYTYPNNHLFHTLLAKVSVALFGDSPAAIRLPAFLAGTLIIPATYAVARAIYGSRAALLAAAIVASSGVLVLYSTNARGYSMIVLAFLLLVLSAIRLYRDGAAAPRSQWLTFTVVAALGLWTIPVMLFPLGAVSVWFALLVLIAGRMDEMRRLGVALVIAGALAALAYWPVIAREGFAAVVGNRFVAASSWFMFFDELPSTVWEALKSWSLGVPPLVSVALLAFAVVALRRHAALSRLPVSLALAAYVWSAWLLVVTHRAPFARVWLWVLPIAAALAAAGVVSQLGRWRRTSALVEERVPAIAVALALGAALTIGLSGAVFLTRDTGTFRDGERAAVALQRVLRSGDRVLAVLPTNGPLGYYLYQLNVDSSYLTVDERSARRLLVVVDAVEGQTLDGIVARTVLRQSASFNQPVEIAALPTSKIYLYERRDAPTP